MSKSELENSLTSEVSSNPDKEELILGEADEEVSPLIKTAAKLMHEIEQESLGKHSDNPFAAAEESDSEEEKCEEVVVDMIDDTYVHYNFSADIAGGNVTSETLLPAITARTKHSILPWVRLLLHAFLSVVFRAIHIHWIVEVVLGVVFAVELFLLFKLYFWQRLEYRRNIKITSDETHDGTKRRVLQDTVRDPTYTKHGRVKLSASVGVVSWNGSYWSSDLSWLSFWRVKLFWTDLLGMEIVVPLELWTSIMAAVNRIAVREEALNAMSIDQAIRGMRSQLSMHNVAEIGGATGDIGTACIHMLRVHYYRNSKNVVLARK